MLQLLSDAVSFFASSLGHIFPDTAHRRYHMKTECLLGEHGMV